MALIACPECEKQMSDTAESCPDCGYKLTPEIVESIKKDEAEKAEKAEKEKQQQEANNKSCLIGCLIFLGICILMAIIPVIVEDCAEMSAQRAREESDDRIRQSVAERSKPKKEELEPLAHDDWVGTWYVESVDGDPTGLGSGSEKGLGDFHWWDWTFHADGRYESKMRQDMGDHNADHTMSGIYNVIGAIYTTQSNRVTMYVGGQYVPVSNQVHYEIGTWSSTEDTLTLKPDDWSTMVFRRKKEE